jgi:lysine N6-hydroxylase
MTKGDAQYDCVGVGVGPANLSLASLLYRHRDITNLFLEKRQTFGWHDGQQIPDTTLQVSILKDLVSLSDPTSGFSFLAYLHEKGQIYHFINAQFDAVPRHEYRNYLEWASRKNENVVFGEQVRSVTFDDDGVFHVTTDRRALTARNVSVGIGYQPWLPPVVEAPSPTQFHVSDFVERGRGLGGKRVCVIGGGQSGAEVFLDLISRPFGEIPRRVSWVSRRRNFYPIDDSPFTNDYYMPSFSDYFFDLDLETRTEFNRQNILTSDGVSEATLRQIYQRIYVQRFIHGAVDQVALYPNCEVTQVASGVDGWELRLANADHPDSEGQIDADVVVWATGQRPAVPEFLAPLDHRMEREGCEYRIDSDFAIVWDGPKDRNIFLQNGALGQRGLADKNLSLIAWRSQRIIDRLRGHRSDDPKPSFLEWSAKSAGDSAIGD